MTEYQLEDLLTNTSLAAVESFGMYNGIGGLSGRCLCRRIQAF